MGIDPSNSVTNTYGQVWDTPNVFVTGAALCPQNPGANPTGTVGAVTYRAAEAIETATSTTPASCSSRGPPMWGSWTFDPLQLAMLAVFVAAYARRATTLDARGRPVAAWRLASFSTGIVLLLVALVSPVHELGEELLFLHMLQHVLLETSHPSSCSWVSTARSFVPCSRCRAWRGSARSRTP